MVASIVMVRNSVRMWTGGLGNVSRKTVLFAWWGSLYNVRDDASPGGWKLPTQLFKWLQ